MRATLDVSADAERHFAFQRQLSGFRDLADVAAGLVGLHAARHSGPYVSAYARLGTYSLTEHTRGPNAGGLIHVRSMRGTIHAFPLELASVAHAATATRLKQSSIRRLARLGFSKVQLARSSSQVLDFVRESQTLPCDRPLEVELRPVLRHLWDTGKILAYDTSGTPHLKRRHFVEACNISQWRDLTEDIAQSELARRYLRAYGPAAPDDLAWWTGWGKQRTQRVLERLRPELVDVRVNGLPQLVLAAQDEVPLRESGGPRPGVHVLAYEDPSIKAYFATRERYLRTAAPGKLFWHAGEALASVLVDGVVAATWRWHPKTQSVEWSPIRELRRSQVQAIQLRAQRVEAWLSSV